MTIALVVSDVDGTLVTPAKIVGSSRDFAKLAACEEKMRDALGGQASVSRYRRRNHDNIHVHGYREEGTTTTPFDMVVLNGLDRYRLALDAVRYIPRYRDRLEEATQRYWTAMERHKLYVGKHGEDMLDVKNWRWSA